MNISFEPDDSGDWDNWSERSEIVITWDDGTRETHFDGGDPEDNRFCRDWSWVSTAIERAYADGRASVISELDAYSKARLADSPK